MKTSPFFLLGLALVFAAGFLALGVKLYRIQLVETATYREDMAVQATRRVRIPGRRGRILDRAGNILAETHAAHDIVCHPEAFVHTRKPLESIDAALDRFAKIMSIPRTVTWTKLCAHLRAESARPLVVVRELDDATHARFAEHAAEFPGFSTEVRAARLYPFHRMAAHLIGYVGRDRPENPDGLPVHYFEPDMKGRAGVEAYYDKYLSGASGDLLVKVNARGFAVGEEVERAASPGLDLTLALDAQWQRVTETLMAGLRGACVVLDPRSGAVRVLVSSPAFDPNDFTPGIPQKLFSSLRDDPNHPLLNRAITGLYAPGSTFKPIAALTALENDWRETDTLECVGLFRKTRCTARWGHGPLTLQQAIEKSCNPFFLQLGLIVGGEKILARARTFGLGSRTGIDLDGEQAGNLAPWHFQSAMGQGPLLVTPLQMAVVCAAFANGGAIYRPWLHRTDDTQIAPVAHLNARKKHLGLVRQGMRDVVEAGSAWRAFHPYHNGRKYTLAVQAAGKTGSAEVGKGENRYKNTWFIAFAPFDAPTVAVAMIVEHGEFGGTTVAPRVYTLLKTIFGEKEASS